MEISWEEYFYISIIIKFSIMITTYDHDGFYVDCFPETNLA